MFDWVLICIIVARVSGSPYVPPKAVSLFVA